MRKCVSSWIGFIISLILLRLEHNSNYDSILFAQFTMAFVSFLLLDFTCYGFLLCLLKLLVSGFILSIIKNVRKINL